uniref:Ig-like domain-containing protein n=1 Tax=Astyanax mexicanus TaxID=7994 RepID=A0A3B1J7J5_ASTMX
MHLYLILSILTLQWIHTISAQLIQVQQDPVELIVSPGSSLKVSCSITGYSNPDLFWYQWTPEAGFTLVFTSRSTGNVKPSEKDRFKSSRPEDLEIVLESDGVGERDSAVWYCAASPHSVPEQLLSCTKTTPASYS